MNEPKKTYNEKLLDPRWQRKRLEILSRDDFTCRDTGETSETLHVHHCHYAKNPWDTPNELLLTLSASAHKARQGLEDRAKLALARICSRVENKEDDQNLMEFVVSLERFAAKADLSNSVPMVIDAMEFDDMADCRWFQEALMHPPFREAYERVTGEKRNWESLERCWRDPDASAESTNP